MIATTPAICAGGAVKAVRSGEVPDSATALAVGFPLK